MSKKNAVSQDRLGQLAWVLPNPEWGVLVIGTGPIVKAYTMCNTSKSSVTISTLELVQNDDSRIRIIGGSCSIGKILLPQESCTVDVELNPRTIGTIKQVLSVGHSGLGSPLWINIIATVATKPASSNFTSYLVDDNQTMERQRRFAEQEGHRRFARVNARDHSHDEEKRAELSHEGELQNNILQNPWLDSQRFDGVDPNLNPEPPLNSEARREFDNERRTQEMEKQLRLGNMPRISPAPKPQGF